MTKTINGESQIHARVDGKEIIITKSSVRSDLRLADEEGVDCLPNFTIFKNLKLMGANILDQHLKDFSSHKRIYIAPSHTKKKPKRKVTKVSQPSEPTKHVAYEAVYKELDYRLVRVATTTSSLEAEQDSGNIDKTESKATPNEASSLRTTSGGGLRFQEAMEDTIAQTNLRMCLNFPMIYWTKTTQALKITSLKRRVKRLEKKQRSRTHKLKRLYKIGLITRVDSSKDDQSLSEDASKQGRKIHDIDADEDITLLNDQDD
nr:hypothetical protein [Tanacetum cinerariifolium]